MALCQPTPTQPLPAVTQRRSDSYMQYCDLNTRASTPVTKRYVLLKSIRHTHFSPFTRIVHLKVLSTVYCKREDEILSAYYHTCITAAMHSNDADSSKEAAPLPLSADGSGSACAPVRVTLLLSGSGAGSECVLVSKRDSVCSIVLFKSVCPANCHLVYS